MVKVTVTGVQQAQAAIKKALQSLVSDDFVVVGIHEDAGQHESDEITNASLGATLHYGAEIDHPGGTSFGFATKAAATRNEIRFLKSGQGYAELGVTGPHKITIPARPWLDVGVASGNPDYIKIIEQGIKKGRPPEQILNMLGVTAVSKVQQFMNELSSPANAPSTIKAKGSSNPLIDSGSLKQSVTYKIQAEQPREGLE